MKSRPVGYLNSIIRKSGITNIITLTTVKQKQSRHAMQAPRRRGTIASTHYWPRHQMGWVVSVTPGRALPPGKGPPGTHPVGGWLGVRAGQDTEAGGKMLCLCRGSNPGHPVCS